MPLEEVITITDQESIGARFLYEKYPNTRTDKRIRTKLLNIKGEVACTQEEIVSAIANYFGGVNQKLRDIRYRNRLKNIITSSSLFNTSFQTSNSQYEEIIKDQKSSLLDWLDFLFAEDCEYPSWLKFHIVNSLISAGDIKRSVNLDYNTNVFEVFTKYELRSKGSQNIFFPFNIEALNLSSQAIQNQVLEDNALSVDNCLPLTEVEEMIKTKDFCRIYLYFLDQVSAISSSHLSSSKKGSWRLFKKASNPESLKECHMPIPVESCLRTLRLSAKYLLDKDVWVYFSQDNRGKETIPRLTIVVDQNGVNEIRGIYPDQNIDPDSLDILTEKLSKLRRDLKYASRLGRVQKLNIICDRLHKGIPLDRDNLLFLYRDFGNDYFFGIKPDPRINLIKNSRNYQNDLAVIYECSEDEISNSYKETVKGGKKVHISTLSFPSVFEFCEETLTDIVILGSLVLYVGSISLPTNTFKNVIIKGDVRIKSNGIILQKEFMNGCVVEGNLVLESFCDIEKDAFEGLIVKKSVWLKDYTQQSKDELRARFPEITFI